MAMKEGLPVAGSRLSLKSPRRPTTMLHVGLDLSRRRLDYLALTEDGNRAEVGAAPPDADGLRGLAVRMTAVRAERERARWRLYLVRQRVRLKQRVHSRPPFPERLITAH